MRRHHAWLLAGLLVPLCAYAWRTPAPSAASSSTAFGEIIAINPETLTTYQAGATPIQDVKPQVLQRGTRLEGSLRAGAPHGMDIAAYASGAVWQGSAVHSGIDLATGSYAPTEVDIALPAPGPQWRIGRSYNAAQGTLGSHFTSNGIQGKNWFQSSMPEIVLYEAASDEDDVVYLVYGADRFAEYQRHSSIDDEFNGRQGAAGVFQFLADNGGSSGEPDTYTLTDLRGTTYTFFSPTDTTDASPALGQLWKIEDAAGNVAFVGDATTASTAISSGYDGSGRITTAYDSADRRYSYTYSSGRLADVEVETKAGGTWASPSGVETVGLVQYTYYTDPDDHGQAGDLEMVKVTDYGSETAGDVVKVQYYRYWEGAFNGSTNPGHEHAIKYVYGFEGTRKFDWGEDGTEGTPAIDDGFLTATNDTLWPYATAYFTYDSSHRISEARFNGDCGCSGAGLGTHTYAYEGSGYANTPEAYDTEWATRTIVARPDGSFLTQYFDEVGQPLSQVLTDDDPALVSPPSKWVTAVVRDGDGLVTEIHTPAANSSYTHSSGAWASSSSAGLIHTFHRKSSGDLFGYLESRRFKQGTGGTEYFLEELDYTSTSIAVGATTVIRPFVSSRESFAGASTDGSGGDTTSYSYSYHSGTLQPASVTTTLPAVSTGKNGSNSSNTTASYFGLDGRVTFQRSARGRISYTEYANGQVTKQIADADLSLTGVGQDFNGVTIPGALSNPGSPLHQVTRHTYDAQGRRVTTTASNGMVSRVYRSKLADNRQVTLSYPKFVAGSPDTYYGPVSYSVRNLGGEVEAQGTIGISGGTTTTSLASHVDELDTDPVIAIDGLGTLRRLTTRHLDESGSQVQSERLYFDIPTSGVGTDGVNYDSTSYGYDIMGRRWRVKEASGTIRRTVFDSMGRVSANWMGTNDYSFSGGESSGPDNMVQTDLVAYDGGNDDGNGLVTSRTLRVTDTTTDERVTTYAHDVRGRVLLETRPEPPHAFHKYDNLGRRTASALYSSIGGITLSTDDPVTEASNRLALSRTYFDEMGRAWKSTRHNIDPADGSDDDNLESLSWYDADGNVIKVDGHQLTKTFYDGLGRVTHEFVLANCTDDSGYGDADDVTGDVVLEEVQTTYEAEDNHVIMRAHIARHHDDKGGSALLETRGALDSNGDGEALLYTAANIKGRIQITAMWYDELHRLQDEVRFGNNGGASFDRDDPLPARSGTALRTTYTYGEDGNVLEMMDPRGLIQRTEHDDAGRVVASIRNYLSGVNGGAPTGSDQNVTVRYEYENGLRTKLIADLPSGSTDQVTRYIYGTTKGTPAASMISTGHKIRGTVYPDSTNTGTTEGHINSDASDVVSYAYNAQGQEVHRQDQAGNVFESVYDTAGRLAQSRVTNVATGFDNHVQRIETAYDDLGRRETVTQYSASTGGTVRDQVGWEYDGWSNLLSHRQDVDSVLDEMTPANEYEVTYTWAKATTGRNTLRRSTIGLPSGASVLLEYLSANNLHDAETSRVTTLKHGTTRVVGYDYNSVGHVVGTDYLEPEVRWRLHEGGGLGSYPDLDAFNRVKQSRWTAYHTSATDFYSVVLGYDENSNITWAEDGVHVGFDVRYVMDDIDRLTQAEEGSRSGSAIADRTRDQQWTLDQVGNWENDKLDLDGDGIFTGTGEWDDCREHNDVNEIESRNLDCVDAVDFEPAYDAAGNLIDDEESYKYVYDAFYRLRKILNQSDELVSELRYNGLGHRIAVHADTDDDGDVDGSDDWEHLVYDERWRLVAKFWDGENDAHEEFLHHQAGLDGHGESSYIDLVVLRDRSTEELGGLGERIYYCQNWRADVSALVSSDGEMLEWVKYSAYGVPFGLPAGDADSDGDRDGADQAEIEDLAAQALYDVRGDMNLDGVIGGEDVALASGEMAVVMGRGVLSNFESKHGFATGLETIPGSSQWHFRARDYGAVWGRWIARDPMAYVDGPNNYAYVTSRPLVFTDPSGMQGYARPGLGPTVGPAVSYRFPWESTPPRLECVKGGCPGTASCAVTVTVSTSAGLASSIEGLAGNALILLQSKAERLTEGKGECEDCPVFGPPLPCEVSLGRARQLTDPYWYLGLCFVNGTKADSVLQGSSGAIEMQCTLRVVVDFDCRCPMSPPTWYDYHPNAPGNPNPPNPSTGGGRRGLASILNPPPPGTVGSGTCPGCRWDAGDKVNHDNGFFYYD